MPWYAFDFLFAFKHICILFKCIYRIQVYQKKSLKHDKLFLSRYRYIFIVIFIVTSQINSEKARTRTKTNHNAATCPYTKIIEDIFKVNNKSSSTPISNSERARLFLHSIAKVTDSNEEVSQEELVNDIIAAINRIKNNITKENNTEIKLNEAIILEPKNITDSNEKQKVTIQIKSGMEDKIDTKFHNLTKQTANSQNIKTDLNKIKQTTTEKTKYIEVLTIEPNNTQNNVSSHNIIEVLKHLMPMFNSTLTKELHNITVIERNFNKNHSFSATKNVSTIVVTYCDKDNSSKTNITFETGKETSQETGDKLDDKNGEYDYYVDNDGSEVDKEDDKDVTAGEKKEILEAAEYGMQKMHELYSVLEPKLYSMGKELFEFLLLAIYTNVKRKKKYFFILPTLVSIV